jgi:hypothetical protein
MAHRVFISYARSANRAHAVALKEKLGDLAFLDVDDIENGDQFTQVMIDALLDASIVVIFASKTYLERRSCHLEMRLALSLGDAASSHLILALGKAPEDVLALMPALVASKYWPAAEETDYLEEFVLQQLQVTKEALRTTLPEPEIRRLSISFIEESKIPESKSLHGVACSLPERIAWQSIGSRFVGRADDLRRLHQALTDGTESSGKPTIRIAAGGGIGKTRLVIEYLHRYGPEYFRGGLFWIDAGFGSIDKEFWRVLKEIEPSVPDISAMRKMGRDVRKELGDALRRIEEPVLFIIDNILEVIPGRSPRIVGDFCPALGSVTVVSTSRQDTSEPGVNTIKVDSLDDDAAILLLTENVPGIDTIPWVDWQLITNWVGNLPIALDLLNRCLSLNSISAKELVRRVRSPVLPSIAVELDRLGAGLRGQVPDGVARGITDVFLISFEKLSSEGRTTAMILAQLASAPISLSLFNTLPEELKSSAVRAELTSRHFVTSGGYLSLGVMHQVMADFLRSFAGGSAPEAAAAAMLSVTHAFPLPVENNTDNWHECSVLLPHALAILDRTPYSVEGFNDEGWLGHRKAQLQDRVTRYRRLASDYEDSKELVEAAFHYDEDERAALVVVRRFSDFRPEIRWRIMRRALEQPENKNLEPIRTALNSEPTNFQIEVMAAVRESSALRDRLRELLLLREATKEDEITKLIAGGLDRFPIHLQNDLEYAYGRTDQDDNSGVIEQFMARCQKEEARNNLRRMLGIADIGSHPSKARRRWAWLAPWGNK